MSGLPCPHCGEMVDVFGAGGGQAVADALTRITGAPVPLLGQVPIDPAAARGRRRRASRWCSATRHGGRGPPAVGVAEALASRSRGLAGRRLGLTPV